MLSYKLTTIAEDDIIRIYDYGVYRFGIPQAESYYDKLYEYFDAIARNPYSFQAADDIKSGYRKCVCGSDVIYYRIMTDYIEISTIIGSQDFQNFE